MNGQITASGILRLDFAGECFDRHSLAGTQIQRTRENWRNCAECRPMTRALALLTGGIDYKGGPGAPSGAWFMGRKG